MPEREVAAFLVWEAVMDTDREAPSAETQARAPDDRVRQYWDPTQRLASAWQPLLKTEAKPVLGKASLVTGDVLWDFVAVFPAGVSWSGAAPVGTVLRAAPVADFAEDLRRALEGR